jgi:SAM-dependent methyltransferase
MKIPLPPVSHTGLENIVRSCVVDLNSYFGFDMAKEGSCWGFNRMSFDDYLSQFDWFKSEVKVSSTLLDVGCSYGRETFALMWMFQAVQASGIDDCREKIDFCYRKPINNLTTLAEKIPKFLDPTPGYGLSEQYVEQFRTWWMVDVPDSIKQIVENDLIPRFHIGNIADRKAIPYDDDYFDLVYCRNVLDELVNNHEDLHAAIENMALVLKPETGLLIVVGATQRDPVAGKHANAFLSLDDMKPQFQELGLRLLDVKDSHHLGFLNWPVTIPKGHIYGKRRKR